MVPQEFELDAQPATLGRYHVLGVLGEGTHGTVYLAEWLGPHLFRHRVAIKVLNPGTPPDVAQRFANEAHILSQLRHPNVVGFIGLEESQSGDLFLVMDHLEGFDLVSLLALVGPLPAGLVAGIARQALIGLAYAHQLRDGGGLRTPVIHRDLKPGNLMVCGNGLVKLLDFGLATSEFRPWESVATAPRGTLRYMPPEQVIGMTSPQSDLFSLAAVMFELLTGDPLYPGQGYKEVQQKVEAAELEEPLARLPVEARVLEPVLRRALAYDPRDRFSSARTMSLALTETGVALASPRRLRTMVREARMLEQRFGLPSGQVTPSGWSASIG